MVYSQFLALLECAVLIGCARYGFEGSGDAVRLERGTWERPGDGAHEMDGARELWTFDGVQVDKTRDFGALDQLHRDGTGKDLTPDAPPLDAGSGGPYRWSRSFGSLSADVGQALAVDPSGNLYLAGGFSGTVSFGGSALASAGNYDIFVASYTPTGAHRWSKPFGGAGADIANAVAADASGNATITGSFELSVDFGGGSPAATGDDIFVASYGTAGAYRWSHAFGGSSLDHGHAVGVDPSGDVAITGDFSGTANFGKQLTSNGSYDIFVASYGPQGTFRWANSFGSATADWGNAVTFDGSGNAVIAGFFTGSVDFGAGSFTTPGAAAFVASYGPTGTYRWAKQLGGVGATAVAGMASDGSGNTTVTGSFQTSVDFGGGPLTSVGDYDGFVASYGPTGAYRWSRRFGGATAHGGKAVAVDASGNVYVTGSFEGTATFGGAPLTSAGGGDIFVASYTPAGVHRWSRRFGGPGEDVGLGVVVDTAGNVTVTGSFSGTAELGKLFTSAGLSDIFLLQLPP